MIAIGEMARLCSTSVQTLCFYDQKGLLKPAYVNPQNHYRYYQTGQIFQFNLIKYLQATDLSLDEINAVLAGAAPDLPTFWQEQVAQNEEQLRRAQQRLQLAQFQIRQSQRLVEMQAHLGQRVYLKKVDQQIISAGAVTFSQKLTPAVRPDQAMASLDQQLLALGQLPNLEYGFEFEPNPAVQQLADIPYFAMFKEPTGPVNQKQLPNWYNLFDVSGTYAAIDFCWDRATYLDHLFELYAAIDDHGWEILGPMYELSYPYSYRDEGPTSSDAAITELRIMINDEKLT